MREGVCVMCIALSRSEENHWWRNTRGPGASPGCGDIISPRAWYCVAANVHLCASEMRLCGISLKFCMRAWKTQSGLNCWLIKRKFSLKDFKPRNQKKKCCAQWYSAFDTAGKWPRSQNTGASVLYCFRIEYTWPMRSAYPSEHQLLRHVILIDAKPFDKYNQWWVMEYFRFLIKWRWH